MILRRLCVDLYMPTSAAITHSNTWPCCWPWPWPFDLQNLISLYVPSTTSSTRVRGNSVLWLIWRYPPFLDPDHDPLYYLRRVAQRAEKILWCSASVCLCVCPSSGECRRATLVSAGEGNALYPVLIVYYYDSYRQPRTKKAILYTGMRSTEKLLLPVRCRPMVSNRD